MGAALCRCRRKKKRRVRKKKKADKDEGDEGGEDEEEEDDDEDDWKEGDAPKTCLEVFCPSCCRKRHHWKLHVGQRPPRTEDDTLRLSCGRGKLRHASGLITKRGVPPNAATLSGYTGLHAAASRGHFEVVSMLVDNNVNVDSATHGKITPLMMAAAGGHKEVVELLLRRGADATLSAKSARSERRAHDFAEGYGYDEIAELLRGRAPSAHPQVLDRQSSEVSKGSKASKQRSKSNESKGSGGSADKVKRRRSSASSAGSAGSAGGSVASQQSSKPSRPESKVGEGIRNTSKEEEKPGTKRPSVSFAEAAGG